MKTILLIEGNAGYAREMVQLLDDHNVTVVSELDPDAVSARQHVDCILMNVQTLVGDDAAYKGDTFDIEVVAKMVVEEMQFYPEARLAIYATIPSRAESLIHALRCFDVRAHYVDYIRWEEFEQFIRDSPTMAHVKPIMEWPRVPRRSPACFLTQPVRVSCPFVL